MRAKKRFITVLGCIVVLLLVLSLTACEKREWSKAQQTNTADAYKAYLTKYPKGKFVNEANAAIENLAWKKAQTANTIAEFEAFLTKYPNSKNAAAANEKIAALKIEAMVAQEKEAQDNLAAIAVAEQNYKAAKKKFLAAKPSPPEGGTDATPDEWSDAGGFTDLGWSPSGPVLYQYAVSVDRKGFKATATGDLDGNGNKVTWTVTADNPTPVKSPEGEY